MNYKALIIVLLMALFMSQNVVAQRITILSANDTHSAILPDKDGMGGLLRHKALVDSVRAADEHVVAVHAGDAVQGTVYFSMFKGVVEYAMHDSIGYDYCILGNHEFDNHINDLAKYTAKLKAKRLSSNYDFTSTPLNGRFAPYDIRHYGDKKIAFIGINLNPEGMIAVKNIGGLVYNDASDVALRLSEYLKNTGLADYVVMISHIGYKSEYYDTDVEIVKQSRHIDLVIGGHSHTLIEHGNKKLHLVKNADGRDIPVVQAGKWGKHVCKVYFDLADGSTEYELMPVNSAYDARANGYTALKDWLKPFDEEVHKVMHSRIADCARAMSSGELTYLPNFVSDAVTHIIAQRWGKVDFAIMNRGGIRQSLPEGELTEGMISSMLPFDNRLVVMDIKGSDLIEAFQVMARRGGDAVSRELEVKYQSPDTILWAKLNGKNIKPEKTYRMVTVDYLANGGDYMEPLTRGNRLFEDTVPYGGLVLEYIKQLDAKGKMVDSDGKKRMHK